MAIVIKTLAQFNSLNPVLADGDWGFTSDTAQLKYGDGVTDWNTNVFYGLERDFIRQLVNEVNTIGSSFGSKVTPKSVDYQMVYTDGLIVVTTGAADKTITLPTGQTTSYTVNGATYYRIYNIKKVDSGVGSVVITPASGTVDGSATYSFNTQYQSVTIQYDGTNWHII